MPELPEIETMRRAIAPGMTGRTVVEVDVRQPKVVADLDAEEFNVMLQARVVQSANRDLVLRFVGTMRDEQSNQTADDGFSQRVTVRTGVAQVGDVTIVNPVYLAPRRTFPEIDQPESPYILRLREGPQAALFRADDQAWRVEAIASIGAWLRDRLQAAPGCVVIA